MKKNDPTIKELITDISEEVNQHISNINEELDGASKTFTKYDDTDISLHELSTSLNTKIFYLKNTLSLLTDLSEMISDLAAKVDSVSSQSSGDFQEITPAALAAPAALHPILAKFYQAKSEGYEWANDAISAFDPEYADQFSEQYDFDNLSYSEALDVGFDWFENNKVRWCDIWLNLKNQGL